MVEFEGIEEKYYGFYRAVVLDNRDPEIDEKGKSYGRVKVFIPALMDDESKGIWAFPANNPIGGRNEEKISKKSNIGKFEYSGSFYVPPNNSWVWVFFENGDPSRPYYFSGLDIYAKEAPPEINVQPSSKPEERWLIFRSPKGRVIIVSDDPQNCRVEITGEKKSSPSNSESHVYNISGNQKTILIDERAGKEKILISDEQGNFINIKTNSNSIEINANSVLKLKAGNAIYIDAPLLGLNFDSCAASGGGFNGGFGGSFICEIGGNCSIKCGGEIALDGATVKTNCGAAGSAKTSDAKSTPPNGSRD